MGWCVEVMDLMPFGQTSTKNCETTIFGRRPAATAEPSVAFGLVMLLHCDASAGEGSFFLRR
jgi:hypothetical protein